MNSFRAALHQLLDELPDEQIAAAFMALTQVQQSALRSSLSSTPALRMPAHRPPQFPDFEPLPYEGEPPSEQFIRERR